MILQYRADIDGLRAVAVLSVVGFHAFPDLIRGGFIGVDIFFVISGFLISTIIFTNLEHNNFSFVAFYSRRIRRIFPGLLIVLICNLAFGWHVLLADEYKQLGKHIAGAAVFISNFMLWQETGYFDNAAATKPLLHLWSLGIEEQFYIMWPLFITLAYKKRINPQLIAISATAFSLAFNIIVHESDPIADFYSPQTRIWELLIGSVLASFQLHEHTVPGKFFPLSEDWLGKKFSPARCEAILKTLHNSESIVGALLICGSILAITQKNSFPGFWAIIPVIGTFLVIHAAPRAWLNRITLSNRMLVCFGLISYPLYLWHWPLLSFAQIVAGEDPANSIRIVIVLISVALAVVTYEIIEKPLRFGKHHIGKTIVLFALMGIFGVSGYLIYNNDGIPSRSFAEQHAKISEAINDWAWPNGLTRIDNDGAVLYGNSTQPAEILFVGDSHIMQYGPRVANLSRLNKMPSVAFMADIGCPIVPFVFDDETHQHCRPFVKNFRILLTKSSDLKKIVIGGCWNCYFIDQTRITGLVRHPQTFRLVNDPQNFYYERDGIKTLFRGQDGKKLALTSLKEMIVDLSKRYSVYLLLDNPNGDVFDPRSFLHNRLNLSGYGDGNKVKLPQEQSDLNDELRRMGLESGAKVIDQVADLCPFNVCARLDEDGRPIYKDENHLRSSFVTERRSPIDDVWSPR